jgi:hypothetical protein
VLQDDHAGERAVFGVALGRELNLTTGERIPVGRAFVTIDYAVVRLIFANINLEADVTFDLQAGFRARDVEVAGAVSVSDAYIFNRFRLSSNDSVSSVSTGNYCYSSSGAEKKALDVHK